MPFTLSHVAAVLPGLRLRELAWPAVPALIAGSMAPDLPYYLPLGMTREESHALSSSFGVALMAVVAAVLWDRVLAQPSRAFAPRAWRARLHGAPQRTRLCDLPLVVVAAYVGVLTHLVLDAPTHADGALTTRVALLRHSYAGVPLWWWLMLALSALGLLLLGVVALGVLRRPAREVTASAWGLWPLVLTIGAGIAGALWALARYGRADIDAIWFATTGGGSALLAALALVVLAWWVLRPDEAEGQRTEA